MTKTTNKRKDLIGSFLTVSECESITIMVRNIKEGRQASCKDSSKELKYRPPTNGKGRANWE